jgi:predicted HicB family RNase H-like nuclease
MPFARQDESAEETKVSIMVRIPWRARRDLRALAEERQQSFNTVLCELLTAASGIDMT